MQTTPPSSGYVLGLDLGTNSVGWALFGLEDGRPVALQASGVRVFEEGLADRALTSGRGKGRGQERRQARQQRRVLDRRARRLAHLFSLLQRVGLLSADASAAEGAHPRCRYDNSAGRDRVLKQVDQEMIARLVGTERVPNILLYQLLPYLLRAQALDRKLEPYELGRSLYHLAQRRGFLSNRRTTARDRNEEKELKGMKAEISGLRKDIAEKGARTLGEYLSRLNPHEQRIRNRHTDRPMYETEFEAMWQAQAPHHPAILTAELKKEVHRAIFHQRPLKSVKKSIGFCAFEPKRRRSPWALLAAQRFRLLQKVNDLLLIDTKTGEQRPPTADERAGILGLLETQGDIKFSDLRKTPTFRKCKFNLEAGGEKRLPGNRTTAVLVGIFGGDRWQAFSPFDRERIVEDVRSIQKDETLAKRGRNVWSLDEEAAKGFSELFLEDGYCDLSREALAKLLPLMEGGVHYAEAVKQVYGEQPPPPAQELLPLVDKAVPELRNPIVARTLTETRKVVNATIRRYGKPAFVHVELARELKRNAEQREAIWNRGRDNEREREAARAELIAGGVSGPSRDDIVKLQLAKECGRECPYTGRSIAWADLFGASPQFQVEHIIPFSRSLDDSFLNKTLCPVSENQVKGNRTPFEAYGSDPVRWAEVEQRATHLFQKRSPEKLRRFLFNDAQLKDHLRKFADRQLTDTAYASRLAVKLLGSLYGGRDGCDLDGTRRVQVSSGGVTAHLRNEWGLNAILGDGDLKARDDHRHHAVDAVVVALTDARAVKSLSDAASRAARERRRRFGKVQPPWERFLDDVSESIRTLAVSHRPSRKVNGPLHEQTNYGVSEDRDGEVFTVVRKKLSALGKKDVENIVDPVVRQLVQTALAGGEPRKLFATPDKHPFLEARDGRRIPIHSVRVRVNERTEDIGRGPTLRHVNTGGNHHVEIFETKDRKGGVKWEGCLVTRLEAMRRLRAHEPVVCSDHGPGTRFLFSLCGGDIIEVNDERTGGRGLYVVRTLTVSRQESRIYPVVEYASATDSREKSVIKSEKQWYSKLLEPMRKLGCRKVTVSPLGEVLPACD